MDGRSAGLEADAVLDELACKIKESKAELSGQNIGNALYGLRGMNGRSAGAEAVLNALACKLKVSKADLSGQEIGNAL